jgi:nucleotidyltransferase/DNA polymerase involved in DNA repair
MLACLFIPLFPLAARLRSEPDLKGEAVAVFEGNGNAARVIASTRKAREKGLRPGMTLPQARSLFPKLLARARDLESERAAQEALLEIADTFSPRVEDAGEGLVYLDLEGLPALARGESSQLSALSSQSPLPRGGATTAIPLSCHPEERVSFPCHPEERSDEGSAPAPSIQNPKSKIQNSPTHALARDIITAAEKASLPLRVGIAASKLAARVAAGLPDSPTVVPEGEEGPFLAPLPLSRLAPAIEIAEMLERWGIRSIGEFARLPEGEVASRLGELGREFHAAARGIDPRPLDPRVPPFDLSEGMDLEWPLVSLEPFLFLGNAALERLVQRLESQGLACVKLETTLKLDPDGCDARSIALPAPTREVKTLLTLVRLELEARPPGAPVGGFTFTAHPDKPRRAQLSLFGPAALSPDRLATTIARLAALLGAGRVGSPRTVNGHRPERFAEVSFAPPPPPTIARPPRTGRGLLAIRVLRPPVPLEVIVESRESRVESLPPLPPGEGRGEGKPTATPATPCHPEPLAPLCHPERSEGSALAASSHPSARDRLREGSAPVVSPITNRRSQITSPPNGLPLPDSYFFPPPEGEDRKEKEKVPPITNHQSPILNPLRPVSLKSVTPPSAAPAITNHQSQITNPSLSLSGSIRVASGPWSLEESWWSETPADRDYWDVELSNGALYRIYRDRVTSAWFADGIYD